MQSIMEHPNKSDAMQNTDSPDNAEQVNFYKLNVKALAKVPLQKGLALN